MRIIRAIMAKDQRDPKWFEKTIVFQSKAEKDLRGVLKLHEDGVLTNWGLEECLLQETGLVVKEVVSDIENPIIYKSFSIIPDPELVENE